MRKYILLFLSLIIGSFIINSCSDNSTNNNNPEKKDYFPSSNGNFWIYKHDYYKDDNLVNDIDSIIIVGKENIKGNNADKYSVYTKGELAENYYRYSDGSKLYALPSELIPNDLIALIPSEVLPQDWVVLADNDNSLWEIFQFDVKDIPLNLSGLGAATLNGVIKLQGKKTNTSTLTIDGKNIKTQNFEIIISYEGKVTLGAISSPLNFNVTTKYYYGENVGLVQTETEKQDISISGIKLYTIQSNHRLLQKYNIITTK